MEIKKSAKTIIFFLISTLLIFYSGIIILKNKGIGIILLILGIYFGYINVKKSPIITVSDSPPKNPSEGEIWLKVKD